MAALPDSDSIIRNTSSELRAVNGHPSGFEPVEPPRRWRKARTSLKLGMAFSVKLAGSLVSSAAFDSAKGPFRCREIGIEAVVKTLGGAGKRQIIHRFHAKLN